MTNILLCLYSGLIFLARLRKNGYTVAIQVEVVVSI